MQKIITKREKIILYTAAGVVMISVVFNLLIDPLLKRREIVNKQTEIVRTKLKKYIWLLSQKDYIQDKYKESASGLNLSNNGASITILSALESLAKDANIRIIDIRPQAAGSVFGSYKEAAVDLRTEGNMEGYIKFLYNIENSLLLLRVKRFQLNAKSKSLALEGIFSISQLSLTE
jgi:hypothetical protein